MLTSIFLRNARALIETDMATTRKAADPAKAIRAKVLERHFNKISRNHRGHAVIEWKVPSASDPSKSYDCYISVEPKHGTLFTLASAGGKIGDKMQLIRQADVRCFCTCPDFRYSGAAYNMNSKYDALEDGHGESDWVNIRPKVRDPRGKQTLCKHLIACCDGIGTNASVILKAARTAKFPKEYTKEPEQVEILGKEQSAPSSGEIASLNGKESPEKPSGEIRSYNSGRKKPVVDYPSEEESIKILGESAPVRNEVTQKALDGLADEMGKEASGPVASGDIAAMDGGESPESPGEGEILAMNDSPQEFDPITGIEDAAQLKIFNPDPDEEEPEE